MITADSVPDHGGSVTLDIPDRRSIGILILVVQNHPYRLTATYSGDVTFASSSFT